MPVLFSRCTRFDACHDGHSRNSSPTSSRPRPYSLPRHEMLLHRFGRQPVARTVVQPACSGRHMPREPPPPLFAHGSHGPSPPSHEVWLLPLAPRRRRPRRGRGAHPQRLNCSPRARLEAARWSRRCTGRRHPGQAGKDRGSVGTWTEHPRVKQRNEEVIPLPPRTCRLSGPSLNETKNQRWQTSRPSGEGGGGGQEDYGRRFLFGCFLPLLLRLVVIQLTNGEA